MRIENFSNLNKLQFGNLPFGKGKKAELEKPKSDQYAPSAVPDSRQDPIIGTLKEYIRNLPDIRADKIAEVRERISNSFYDDLSGELADKLVGALN